MLKNFLKNLYDVLYVCVGIGVLGIIIRYILLYYRIDLVLTLLLVCLVIHTIYDIAAYIANTFYNLRK